MRARECASCAASVIDAWLRGCWPCIGSRSSHCRSDTWTTSKLIARDDTLRAVAESRPAALPPAQRTVGQLVAESIRFYGDHFAPVLLLGLPFLAIDVISLNSSVTTQTIVAWVLGPAICAAYVRACMLLGKAF